MGKAGRPLSRGDSPSVPWRTLVRRLSPIVIGQRGSLSRQRGPRGGGTGLGEEVGEGDLTSAPKRQILWPQLHGFLEDFWKSWEMATCQCPCRGWAAHRGPWSGGRPRSHTPQPSICKGNLRPRRAEVVAPGLKWQWEQLVSRAKAGSTSCRPHPLRVSQQDGPTLKAGWGTQCPGCAC